MGDSTGLRAGIYERVSVKLTGKEARSVAEQNARNKTACEKHGWSIGGHYADPGVSASRYARQKRRAEYERMRADVADGLLDVIVVWKANRIDRKLGEWSALLEECRERRVKIYITYNDHLYDPRDHSDWRQLAIDGVAAAADSDQISADVKRGMQANLEEGKPHGPTPFGYKRLYDEYRNIIGQVPDPTTGPIRREIVQRVAAGEPLTAISSDLQRQKAPTPRKGHWSTSSIRSLVLSPVNVAQRRYDPEYMGTGMTTRGADWWEPLIDEPTWRAACDRLRASRRDGSRPGAKEHRYLLSYLAICGRCGGRLGVRSGRWAVPAYCCWAKGCTGIRHDWLDEYVTGYACTRLNSPDFWDEVLNTSDDAARKAREEAVNLRRQIADYEDQALASPAAIGSLGRVITGLQAKMRDAERRGSVSTAPPHLRALYEQKDVTGVRELFERRPIPVRKQILRDVYDGIILLPTNSKGRQPGFDRRRVLMVPKKEWS